jgi:hypothetical protein
LPPRQVSITSLAFRALSFTHLWMIDLGTAPVLKTSSSFLTAEKRILCHLHSVSYAMTWSVTSEKHYLSYNSSFGFCSIINNHTVNFYVRFRLLTSIRSLILVVRMYIARNEEQPKFREPPAAGRLLFEQFRNMYGKCHVTSNKAKSNLECAEEIFQTRGWVFLLRI